MADLRVEAVLFDFGGVIVDSPFGAFAEIERDAGLPEGFLRAVNSRDPDANAWARFERGEVTLDEFCALFEAEAAALGSRVDARAVIDRVVGIPSGREHARPEIVAAAQACRERGVRIGVITNNVRPMSDAPDTAWVAELFDAVVESCLVGVRKPEPAIYELACAALDSAPERTAMLDDLGINLKPAQALGMHTIKVVDPAQAAADLLALVGPA